MAYIFLIVALTLNAAANVLLKVGAGQFGLWSEPGIIARLSTNYYLMAGLLLFALNAAFYVAALSQLNLSVAYPVMVVGGVAIVVSSSIFFLGETLAISQVTGLVLLTTGAILLLRHQPLG
jgi:multidrug transporter EmrE-like cation transporter